MISLLVPNDIVSEVMPFFHELRRAETDEHCVQRCAVRVRVREGRPWAPSHGTPTL